jgi:hypothetical protein
MSSMSRRVDRADRAVEALALACARRSSPSARRLLDDEGAHHDARVADPPATIAICSGVTSIRSWPKAIRPASTSESRFGIPELADSCRARSDTAPRRVSSGGRRRSPNLFAWSRIRFAPSALPTLQKTELTE